MTDERQVLAAIDDDRIVADLLDLIRIPSMDGTAGEIEVQEWCARRLREIGMTVDHWRIDLDELRVDPDFPGMEVDRSEAWGVAGVIGGDGEPALILNGHVNVVPAPRSAFEPVVRDGVVSGRGACDMKGGVAALIGAATAVAASGIHLTRPLAIHTVIGEEDGGLGTFATLRRGHRGTACLIAEPTAGQVVPANAGALTFRLSVPGLATHGSTRTRGVSAITAFETIHAALRDLEASRNQDPHPVFAHLDLPYPLSVGTIHAGDWASTVPDHLVAEGRYGVQLGESVSAAKQAFEDAVARVCAADDWLRDHPVKVAWPGGMFASAALEQGHPFLAETLAAIDREAEVRGGPYGSDLRHYIAAGIPALQYGPGDVRYAHATDEHVVVSEVLQCARVYARLAVRRCS